MKVLWISNTLAACPGRGGVHGGWLSALDLALAKHSSMEITVASYVLSERIEVAAKRRNYCSVGSRRGLMLINKLKYAIFGLPESKIIADLAALVDKEQPDIIHLHGTENVAYVKYIQSVRIPCVISIQGSMLVCAHKYEDGLRCGWRDYISWGPGALALRYTPPQMRSKFKRFALHEARMLSHAKYVIGRTDWDRRLTAILNPNRKYFIGDELLRDNFYSANWRGGTTKGPKVIMTTLSPNYYKGLEVILEAAHLLTKHVDFEWQVCGVAANSPLVRKIEREKKCTFADGKVSLLGDCNASDVARRLEEADLYASASHVENSPNNVCEAQLVGIPCIATCAGGTSSLVINNKTGLIVPTGDPWSLAGAILDLLNNREMAARFANEGKVTAQLRHNIESVSVSYESIYKTILGEESALSKNKIRG